MRLLILTFVILAGCSSNQYLDGDQAPDGVRKRFPSYNQSECKKHKGIWRVVSAGTVFRDNGYCMTKAADGGKLCKSSRDCESYCELSMEDQDAKPRCASTIPPRWDRCVPGYYEHGKVLGRGECFGDDSEVQ